MNVPSRTDTTAAPDGCNTLIILALLAPGLPDTPAIRERFYTLILDHLERSTGETIRNAIAHAAGIRLARMPVTAERVLDALDSAG